MRLARVSLFDLDGFVRLSAAEERSCRDKKARRPACARAHAGTSPPGDWIGRGTRRVRESVLSTSTGFVRLAAAEELSCRDKKVPKETLCPGGRGRVSASSGRVARSVSSDWSGPLPERGTRPPCASRVERGASTRHPALRVAGHAFQVASAASTLLPFDDADSPSLASPLSGLIRSPLRCSARPTAEKAPRSRSGCRLNRSRRCGRCAWPSGPRRLGWSAAESRQASR